MVDEDEEEETYMIYSYEYNNENKLERIVKTGFYERKENIIPTIIYDFMGRYGRTDCSKR